MNIPPVHTKEPIEETLRKRGIIEESEERRKFMNKPPTYQAAHVQNVIYVQVTQKNNKYYPKNPIAHKLLEFRGADEAFTRGQGYFVKKQIDQLLDIGFNVEVYD